MNESLIQSLDEIKEAFKNSQYDPETIMMGSLTFLRQAVAQRDQAVKEFLLTLAKTPATTPEERFAVARAISWLGHYKDPDLLPLFVQLLSRTEGMAQHETILSLVELDDLRAAGALAALLEDESNSPRDYDFLLNALAATGAAEYIEVIAAYLSHPNAIVRVGAITSLLLLGAKTGRKEVLEMVMPYLEDEEQYVRIKTAYHINMRFPNEFYDRGLAPHLPEGLRFPRPKQQQEPQRPRRVPTPSRQLAMVAAAD